MTPIPEQLAEADRVCFSCSHMPVENAWACRNCVAAALAAAFERGREEEREKRQYYIRRIADDYTYHHSAGYFMPDIFDGSSYPTEAIARENIRLLEQSDRVHKRPKVEYDVVMVVELDRKTEGATDEPA